MHFDTSLLRNYWHLLCHRSELLRSGDFVRFETAIGEVVAFNDGKSVVAFDNRCPHRGAQIYGEAFGNSPATCPYHGWTHRAGRMFVANKERFAGCDLSAARLSEYQTAWVGDFLFFSVTPIQSVEEQLGELCGLVAAISRNIASREDFNTYTYECYWPIAVENALEPYHINLIHPRSLGLLDISDGENSYFGRNSIWRAAISDKRSEKMLRSIKKLFTIEAQFDGYEFLYLYPFSMISSTFGYSYSVQSFFPRDQNSTSFYSRLLSARTRDDAARKALASFFSSSATMNRQVFQEDHAICKRMPPDSWSADPLKFAANNEEKIQHFRQSCRSDLAALD